MTAQPRPPVEIPASADVDVRRASLDLIESCGVAIVGSLGPDGRPWTKGMLKLETEDLKTVWFSTNTSSSRVAQFQADSRASVYFVDMVDYRGLLLLGTMEVLRDCASRERLWRDGFEIYYPLGVDDPDHAVLRFTAESGNYYHGLKNTTFTV
ncbi:MAG: pyridoxamine 5'-phosphate oxidase family protein [Dactylosporangium sp.]|nr:pyridoxamine 5'-phosphate oxidase family protein [Dactylosporangium sp.]NNJ60971.1 pyridoxamine 5'-phosphate oxidase family protein [Dactylosporangium sp.]